MSAPQDSENQSEGSESKQKDDATCGSGCGCHSASQSGKARWAIGVIVLLAAGAMVIRAMNKPDVTNPPILAPAFAATTTGPKDGGEMKAPKSDSIVPMIAVETTAGTTVGALSELNNVAANTDAVFIFVPGKEQSDSTPPLAQMKEATRMIEEKAGKKCGIFTLKPGSRDYDQIAAQMSVPAVLAMVKGGGMSAISGEITDAKLVQGFVSASSAGGCGSGGGGCSPAAAGCK